MDDKVATSTRLCETCRKLTLQSLYKGTPSFALGDACDVCELIRGCLTSSLQSSDGHELPTVALQVGYDERGEDEPTLVGLVHLASHKLKQKLLEVEPSTRRLVKITAYPFALLDVRAAGKRVASLKATPIPGSRQALASRICGRQIRPAASQDNVDMVKGWISTCVASHFRCRKAISGKFVDDRLNQQPLPTRLIQVSPKPRLCITAGQLGQYLALSYCWGTGQSRHAVTTKATIEAFQDNIPLDSLAPTVRDAILLVQRLGFQYLWVDALCIIQGDEADWKTESQAMGRVFENALCTITALGAKHADDGLFLSGNSPEEPRPTGVLFPCLNNAGKVLGYASLTVWPGVESEAGDAVSKDYLGSRWGERGWVLQERLLSRRMVYFGQHQMYWTCGTHMIFEDGINHNLPNAMVLNCHSLSQWTSALRKGTLPHLLSLLEPLIDKSYKNGTRMQEIWELILGDYGSCHLTMQSDKLMAVAGLAACFATLTGQTYFEGIWIETASLGLAWKAQRLQPQAFASHGKISPPAICNSVFVC
ncbi:hypothetical protein S40293_10304 [Stachybotrys chartarum IBT 40293]|nr:hypothetical protein S40293_10304 [Stachybotrys chartarum IBT 40293]